jgi:transposase
VEDFVGPDNEVRLVDAFVEHLDLAAAGLVRGEPAGTGRPRYAPGDLLKLWLWGYLNKLSSSRRLERECGRNLEVLWLLKQLRPDHWTICAFRRQAGPAFKAVLRQFVLLAQGLELIEGRLVVIDGTKLKASNHPTRQITATAVAEKIATLEAQIESYLAGCEQADEGVVEAAAPLESLQAELVATRAVQEQMVQNGREKLPVTDPECRPLRKVGLGYNAQIAVDASHHLIVAAEIVDASNDQQQLAGMAEAARAGLGQSAAEPLTVVADAGYYDRVSLLAAEQANVKAYVPRPRKGHGQEEGRFHKSEFRYEAERDVYHCPGGAVLSRVTQSGKRGQLVYFYGNAKACRGCPLRAQCTTADYRRVERWEHEAVLDRATARLAAAPEMMKLRRSVVEHPFGTIKFWGGHWAVQTRGMAGARTEFTLSVLAYNLRRLLKLVPMPKLLAELAKVAKLGSSPLWADLRTMLQRLGAASCGLAQIFSVPELSARAPRLSRA